MIAAMALSFGGHVSVSGSRRNVNLVPAPHCVRYRQQAKQKLCKWMPHFPIGSLVIIWSIHFCQHLSIGLLLSVDEVTMCII